MKNFKAIAILSTLAITTGCETLSVIGSGAMAGAGLVMAGTGIANGDAATAAAGGFLVEAGFSSLSDDSDGFMGDALQTGVASGLAAETGDLSILMDADSPEKMQQHLSRVDPALGLLSNVSTPTRSNSDPTGTSGFGDETFNRPLSGGNCQAQEDQLTREIEAASARASGLGICDSSKVMRDVAVKVRDFVSSCPINDPTGEMLAWANETISTTTQNIRNVCVN